METGLVDWQHRFAVVEVTAHSTRLETDRESGFAADRGYIRAQVPPQSEWFEHQIDQF